MPQATWEAGRSGGLPAAVVLPARAPEGLEHASSSSLWAACCLSFKAELSPLAPSLPTPATPTVNLQSLKPTAAVGPLSLLSVQCELCLSFSVLLWQPGLFLPLFRSLHRQGDF